MSDTASGYTIYPKRYWDASVTWRNWNKLTATDLHALRAEPGFEGQNVYFYCNHPIQYVRVVGVVVEIELRGKYTFLSIDDSSGTCLDIKIIPRDVAHGDGTEYSSNTVVENLDVQTALEIRLLLNSKLIDIGSVIEAKGTISTFRDIRQLDLKRMFIIPNTNAEAAAWAKTAQWKRDVLSKPWVLSAKEAVAIDENLRRQERAEREGARKKREWGAKYGEKKRLHDVKREAKREKAEQKYNVGALRGSNVVRAPWD